MGKARISARRFASPTPRLHPSSSCGALRRCLLRSTLPLAHPYAPNTLRVYLSAVIFVILSTTNESIRLRNGKCHFMAPRRVETSPQSFPPWKGINKMPATYGGRPATRGPPMYRTYTPDFLGGVADRDAKTDSRQETRRVLNRRWLRSETRNPGNIGNARVAECEISYGLRNRTGPDITNDLT